MAARKRNDIGPMPSSDSTMTYTQFLRLFPDNDTCLDYLRDRYYPAGSSCPKCGKSSRFHRITGRSAYSCQFCGHHVYPTARTIFHKSTVNLQLWFYAIFLMSSTRCGISAKQLEREIGVSNKTALRMFRQIRTLLHEDVELLGGEVEVDETYVGGKRRGAVGRPLADDKKKTPVLGMVERGGRVLARVVPDAKAMTLMPIVKQHVLPRSMVYTDEWHSYKTMTEGGYKHQRIAHKQKIYVMGTVHTNTIEGFFGLVKTGIRGVYHSVSKKWLQTYLDEYAFRYNHRKSETPMFWLFLDRVRKQGDLAYE
jgi:transposase-like protein